MQAEGEYAGDRRQYRSPDIERERIEREPAQHSPVRFDDAAEQDRLVELQRRHGDVGGRGRARRRNAG